MSDAGARPLSPLHLLRADADQQEFVRLFLERRGNLREVEKALGVSYPVRGKLEVPRAWLALARRRPAPRPWPNR